MLWILSFFIAIYRETVAPSRGRGSKQLKGCAKSQDACRPFTGAWIETPRSCNRGGSLPVAPSRGRGSKLIDRNLTSGTLQVAPSRGRGSKHALSCTACRIFRVAPSRGRGSKLAASLTYAFVHMSPLHGGVDRNRLFRLRHSGGQGRPFTGAWIETRHPARGCRRRQVAPSRGRGSKPPYPSIFSAVRHVAPSRGRGSKQQAYPSFACAIWSPLHGGVDRNGMNAAAIGEHRPFTAADACPVRRQSFHQPSLTLR